MDLEKYVAVSGISGLLKLVANRNNGLIVEDLGTGKRRFVPARGHQFTPLASIGIYTNDGDSTELKNVFQRMLEKLETNPPVDANANADILHTYFADILPEYDRDRVNTGDIKKVIKWFTFLNAKDLLNETEPEEEQA
jgi:hypothetical protein